MLYSRSSDYAACIKIDNESHKVSVELPLANYTNDNVATDNSCGIELLESIHHVSASANDTLVNNQAINFVAGDIDLLQDKSHQEGDVVLSDAEYAANDSETDLTGCTSDAPQDNTISNKDLEMTTGCESIIQNKTVENIPSGVTSTTGGENQFIVDTSSGSGLLTISTIPNSTINDEIGNTIELKNIQGMFPDKCLFM